MDFLALAEKRYSVRKFKTRNVEKDKIDRILEAARLAPTAVNAQPQRILVLRTKESLAKLKECTQFHFDAPLAFLVCYDKSSMWTRKYDGQTSGEIDAAIVGTHMMMEAADLGLGSTWVMSFDPAAMRKAYSIPEDLMPVALFPMGYAADDAGPGPRHSDRLPLERTVSYDTF